MTTTELLADLAFDDDLQGTIANLEGTYLNPLEQQNDLDPLVSYHINRVRDSLAVAALAIKRLANCKKSLAS